MKSTGTYGEHEEKYLHSRYNNFTTDMMFMLAQVAFYQLFNWLG